MNETLQFLQTDYDSNRDAVLARIRARWPLTWNDFLANNFGMLVVDLIGYSNTTNAFLINRQAGENFVATMTLRESAIRFGGSYGFRLRGTASSVVAARALVAQRYANSVTISAGLPVVTSDPDNSLPFEVAKDYIIQAGELGPALIVAVFDSELVGSGGLKVQADFYATQGSEFVDLTDPLFDLRGIVEIGQTFRVARGETEYVIADIQKAPGDFNYSRLLLEEPWREGTTRTPAEVVDQRVLLVQGRTVTEVFYVSAAGGSGFSYALPQKPYVEVSETVTVNDRTWTRVDSLAASDSEAEVYALRLSADNQIYLMFGDGFFGAALPANAKVTVTYRIGGGTAGNVGAGAVQSSVSGVVSVSGQIISILLSNSTPGVGGLDEESLNEARARIPLTLRANDRGVTAEDYQTIATSFSDQVFGQVRYARVSVQPTSPLEKNVVQIHAWTSSTDGALVSLTTAMKRALQDYIQSKSVGTDYVVVLDGTTQSVPVAIRFRGVPGARLSDVEARIKQYLTTMTAQLVPGQSIIYSDLVVALSEISGVDSLSIATPIDDLTPSTDTELFVAPSDSVLQPIDVASMGQKSYTAQIPVSPLAAWALRLYLSGNELIILPDTELGFAWIQGAGLYPWSQGVDADPGNPETNFGKDTKSRLDLRTGKLVLVTDGSSIGQLQMSLRTAQGFDREREIKIFATYIADTDNQTKRREIRAALRAWVAEFAVGGGLFAIEVPGLLDSKSNVKDVIFGIAGVEEVSSVSLGSPGSAAVRAVISDTELVRLGSIVLNGFTD